MELPLSLSALNAAGRQWMNPTANVRIHGETRKRPAELFLIEREHLKPLTPLPPDTGITRTVRVTNRCRVVFDTNRYSVPSLYASKQLTLKSFSERLCIYYGEKLVASHPRCYDRGQDFEDPEPVKELLERRGKAFKQWTSIFKGDATITSAVLDRLLHHTETVVIEGKSYRMKARAEP